MYENIGLSSFEGKIILINWLTSRLADIFINKDRGIYLHKSVFFWIKCVLKHNVKYPSLCDLSEITVTYDVEISPHIPLFKP